MVATQHRCTRNANLEVCAHNRSGPLARKALALLIQTPGTEGAEFAVASANLHLESVRQSEAV
jgi:hypothetical protein